MKKIFIILVAVLFMARVLAQSSQKMNYQAVIRNSSNALVVSQAVGMRISIIQGSATGTEVYLETQTPTSNANGLISIEIGNGAGFSTINWAAGPYFIKIEIDPSGGSNYTITGTSQLLSVPYAIHAKTSETLTGTITETDPQWSISPSFGITSTNISNWNNAFIWGNHATAGYLTNYTEADSIFIASPANGITSTNISNWNNAFIWGNHATAGYLKSYTETDPVFSAHLSSHITGTDTANWNHKFNIPSLTTGSVLFSNGNTIIENNNKFFWDNSNMKLGIGTNALSASAVLDVFSSDRGVLFPRMTTVQRLAIAAPADGLMVYDITLKSIFFFTDTYGWRNVSLAGPEIINPGETNIIWYPNKGSFLIGNILVESQDSIGLNSFVSGFECKAIGDYSLAIGYGNKSYGLSSVSMGSNCTAKGLYSIAMGYYSIATGSAATAFGNNSKATGIESFAVGLNCLAAGSRSVALGSGCQANGSYSLSMGYNNNVVSSANYSVVLGHSNTTNNPYSIIAGRECTSNGNYGIVFGYQSSASANYATSIGRGNNATGLYSTSLGYNNIASGTNSLTMGYASEASGNYSSVSGYYATAQTYASFVIGRYNLIEGTTTSWIATEPLFVAGNGISTVTRSNAMTLYKNGNMTIAGLLTQGSDKRLKKNIEPLNNVISQIQKINPVYFEFINQETHPSGRQIGFIAQEIQALFPELVKEDSNGYLSVDYSRMSVVLWQAFKEQQLIISKQEQENIKLKGQIEEIMKRLDKLENK